MSDFPLAYHLTFGTYGMRLHGDERGTVDRRQNQPGDPIIGCNPDWQRMERTALKFAPIIMSEHQRHSIEIMLPDICVRGGWHYHVAAGQPDHVHILLSASVDGTDIRPWLKRWLGQGLSKQWPLPKDATWWAECGSVKWVWTQEYYERVYEYIQRQRTTP